MTHLWPPGLGLALLVLCSPAALAATQGRAESGFPFDPVHARAVALGGVGAALPGVAFSFLNPAALAGERGAEVSHRASPTGARDYLISVGHGGAWGTIRLTARRRDWGEIARDLGVDGLTAGEQSVALTLAKTVARGRLAWGASIARLDADYVGAKTGTWAMDLGAQAQVGRGFALGVSLLHAGSGFSGGNGRAPLPRRIRSGAAWEGRVGRLELGAAADLAMSPAFDSPPDLHGGAEVGGTWGAVTGALRGGYRSLVNRDGSGSRQGAWALGGGLRFARVAADVAYTFGAVFGEDRFISLTIRW